MGIERTTETKTTSQTDVVVERIRQMILNGTLQPGGRLPVEKDLAESMGVSRGSLREGVRSLSTMGVLDVRQGSGTFVSSLGSGLLLAPLRFVVDLHEAGGSTDLHSVRRVLETEAAALAAARITPEQLSAAELALEQVDVMLAQDQFETDAGLEVDLEFHRIIAEASGNPVLSALIQSLSSHTVRARVWRAIAEDGVAHSTHQEHRAILAALHDRDPERARLRMGLHLLGVENYVASGPAPE